MSELASLVANGQTSQVKAFILKNGPASLNTPGKDGTTPLCAAALWGNNDMVKLLLEAGANIDAQNKGTLWTALHAATFQEHGKVVHTLTLAGADIKIKDKGGITPIDFASISEAIWPHFSVKGATKTPKDELLAKNIIRKIAKGESRRPESRIKSLSERPGSAYVRAQKNPFAYYSGSSSEMQRSSLSRAGAPPLHPGSGASAGGDVLAKVK